MILLFLIAASFFSLLIQPLVSNSWYLFLFWNFLLAIIPLGLNLLTEVFSKFKLFILPVWILFIPNSFYVLTDLVHPLGWWKYNPLQKTDVFLITPVTFSSIISFNFVMVCLWVIVCWIIAVWSYNNMSKQFTWLNKTSVKLGLSLLFAFGVVLGRFSRLNSWDLAEPSKLVAKSFETFTGLFTVPVYGVSFLVFSGLIFVSLVYSRWFERCYKI
jgi:uncharacterized membrane protein